MGSRKAIVITALLVAPVAATLGYLISVSNALVVESSIEPSTVAVKPEGFALPTAFNPVTEDGVSGLEVVLPNEQASYAFCIKYDCSTDTALQEGPILFKYTDGVLHINDALLPVASDTWSPAFGRIDDHSYDIYLHYKEPNSKRSITAHHFVRVVFEDQ